MTPEPKIHRAVRAGGMTIALRNTRRELYIPCTMTSNNAEWERGWFYLRNDGAGLPTYSGKVLIERADSWHHGVSPPSHQARLDSLLDALKALANGGLTAGCILANLHHRRIVPLRERPLRIFEMHEDADPSRWRSRDCCRASSRGSTRPLGRNAPLTSGPAGTTTRPCGHSPCSPSARW
jgi:hypothetical protein